MDKRKSKFLDIVAHDLRTPLTSILSYADLLLRSKSESEETRDEFLQTIIYESRRLGELINDYLDLSKIEAGLTKFYVEPLDFRKLIDHAVSVYTGACIQKGIVIRSGDVPAELPMIGDKARLTQVMSNLMSNASKFTPNGGEIEIRAKFEKRGRELHVSVCDTGPGVPETHLDEIFKKFAQVQEGDIHTVGGTGIGLSICKEIVEFHQGKIWVENLEDGGACFHVVLSAHGAARTGSVEENMEEAGETSRPPRSS
jgi:signal transduction histidine kinase